MRPGSPEEVVPVRLRDRKVAPSRSSGHPSSPSTDTTNPMTSPSYGGAVGPQAGVPIDRLKGGRWGVKPGPRPRRAPAPWLLRPLPLPCDSSDHEPLSPLDSFATEGDGWRGGRPRAGRRSVRTSRVRHAPNRCRAAGRGRSRSSPDGQDPRSTAPAAGGAFPPPGRGNSVSAAPAALAAEGSVQSAGCRTDASFVSKRPTSRPRPRPSATYLRVPRTSLPPS